MLINKLQIACQKIISGGQTGVDRGTLDACINWGFEHGGWCPYGRMAEDGRIDIKYNLKETEQNGYNSRTYKNVEDSGGTLIISTENIMGGTLLTLEIANQLQKPVLALFPEESDTKHSLIKMIKFIQNNKITILNVAGPRQSEWENGYKYAYQLISELVQEIQKTSQNRP